MFSSRRRGTLAVLAATGMIAAAAGPANATDNYAFNITDNPGGNDGAGQAWGNIQFVDNDLYKFKIYTKDVCPADGHSVTSFIQHYADKHFLPNEVEESFRDKNDNGCGSTEFHEDSVTVSPLDYGDIYRVRVGVRVDNGGVTTWTAWLDNPYSNDPSVSGPT